MRRPGVLVPAGNPTVEPELYRMAPPSVTIHFARLESVAGEPGGADAVLISGTGLPTAGIVERLEAAIARPVVTSQTATLWFALRAVGVDDPVRGYGRLLAETSSGR